MTPRWLVTPYFFECRDDALGAAVPEGTEFTLNAPGKLRNRSPGELARRHRPIADFVEKASTDRDLPVSIAGDCMASLPVMAGLQASGLKPVLVWLDAHGDFNTAATSPSGFLGGMPLAMMVGRGDQTFATDVALSPVDETDTWLVDARELDPLERRALDGSGVNRLTMAGFAQLVLHRPVHLHIDNDVIDGPQVPANNYCVPGGPGLQETIDACVQFAGSNDVRAISFSGWNGKLDKDGLTRRACARLLADCVGAL